MEQNGRGPCERRATRLTRTLHCLTIVKKPRFLPSTPPVKTRTGLSRSASADGKPSAMKRMKRQSRSANEASLEGTWLQTLQKTPIPPDVEAALVKDYLILTRWCLPARWPQLRVEVKEDGPARVAARASVPQLPAGTSAETGSTQMTTSSAASSAPCARHEQQGVRRTRKRHTSVHGQVS